MELSPRIIHEASLAPATSTTHTPNPRHDRKNSLRKHRGAGELFDSAYFEVRGGYGGPVSRIGRAGTARRVDACGREMEGGLPSGLSLQFLKFRSRDRRVPLEDSAHPVEFARPLACSTASRSKLEGRSQSPSAKGAPSSSFGRPAPLRVGP
jgi:hypothetical protein